MKSSGSPPYIVFTGTASVGKTTTLKAIVPILEKVYGEPVIHIAEVARSLEKRGYKINKEATIDTQQKIEDEYIRLETEYAGRIKVADRSIIDRYSYTILNVGNSEGETQKEQSLLSWYDSNIVDHCKKYSHIFHIPLTDEVKLELDGVRSSDERYRKEIADLQASIIKEYRINVFTLTGSTDQRVATILDVLEKTSGSRI